MNFPIGSDEPCLFFLDRILHVSAMFLCPLCLSYSIYLSVVASIQITGAQLNLFGNPLLINFLSSALILISAFKMTDPKNLERRNPLSFLLLVKQD